MKSNFNDLSQSPLGKPASYICNYSPSLIYPISRKNQREKIGIKDPLPFHGEDIWNAYELSWLNPKGKPEIAYIEFRIPCTSICLLESKSLKLYFNSFNQTIIPSIEHLKQLIQKDLSKYAQENVEVRVIPAADFSKIPEFEFDGICLDNLDVTIDKYEIDASFLKTKNATQVEETLYSRLLKTNCPVTNQPDWASIQISYKGFSIDHAGLLKYIVSYRLHQEFHEQCVEQIFRDIKVRCKPEQLTVYGRYTRRGGLDINPYRSSHKHFAAPNHRLFRQ